MEHRGHPSLDFSLCPVPLLKYLLCVSFTTAARLLPFLIAVTCIWVPVSDTHFSSLFLSCRVRTIMYHRCHCPRLVLRWLCVPLTTGLVPRSFPICPNFLWASRPQFPACRPALNHESRPWVFVLGSMPSFMLHRSLSSSSPGKRVLP